MPLYDLRCPLCGHIEEDVLIKHGYIPTCPICSPDWVGTPNSIRMEKMLPLVAKTPNKWKV